MAKITFIESAPDKDPRTVITELERGASDICLTYHPTNEEPICIRILPSGWHSYFHVIIEYGDFEQSDHFLLTAKDIAERYDIRIVEDETIVTGEELEVLPNDHDLGMYVRKKIKANI